MWYAVLVFNYCQCQFQLPFTWHHHHYAVLPYYNYSVFTTKQVLVRGANWGCYGPSLVPVPPQHPLHLRRYCPALASKTRLHPCSLCFTLPLESTRSMSVRQPHSGTSSPISVSPIPSPSLSHFTITFDSPLCSSFNSVTLSPPA